MSHDADIGLTTTDGAGLEVWGGIECTVNRVGERFFSQLERNAHAASMEALDQCAALGIRTLRYPVLWERAMRVEHDAPQWQWSDQRLGRLRELGIRTIAGLVHHGSGPSWTSLVDPQFPQRLAAYAAAVARRYPWLEDYTPVNEPLTTARFSGLMGIWHPHGRDIRIFKDALLIQCRAIVLAMREIRRVTPAARLTQTDDLGKTFSRPLLAYQADFQNEFRWLGWDLLCGRVDRQHPLWEWLTEACGASEVELMWFADNPCAPDVIGVNYYITSERLLDENLDRYPPHYHGGNQWHRYADVEAARCLASPTGGLQLLLQEAWQRYGLPLAVTEVHIDTTREDQMRWLMECWNAAQGARDAGADIRALTVWGLFGLYDWNCLVTECHGYYEPGAFDTRGAILRPTAIAQMMRDLAATKTCQHPVLCGPGWWHRPDRFLAAPVDIAAGDSAARASSFKHDKDDIPAILITGATGTLGQAFARICDQRGLGYRLMSRAEMDIGNTVSIQQAIQRYRPWAVINAAGYVRVDDAEHDVERCFRENTQGPANLAAECARHDIRLVTYSTDMVFDGARHTPYIEEDPVAPINVYGRSKAEAEARVLKRHARCLVIRTSSFFGPWDRHNFVTLALSALRDGRPFAAASDITVSPTYVPDLVNVSLDLLIDGATGIWHLSNGRPVTWAELVVRAAEHASIGAGALRLCKSAALGFIAPRPAYSALGSRHVALMPDLDDALGRYAMHWQNGLRQTVGLTHWG